MIRNCLNIACIEKKGYRLYKKCTKDLSVEDSVHVWKCVLAHTINVHYND